MAAEKRHQKEPNQGHEKCRQRNRKHVNTCNRKRRQRITCSWSCNSAYYILHKMSKDRNRLIYKGDYRTTLSLWDKVKNQEWIMFTIWKKKAVPFLLQHTERRATTLVTSIWITYNLKHSGQCLKTLTDFAWKSAKHKHKHTHKNTTDSKVDSSSCFAFGSSVCCLPRSSWLEQYCRFFITIHAQPTKTNKNCALQLFSPAQAKLSCAPTIWSSVHSLSPACSCSGWLPVR